MLYERSCILFLSTEVSVPIEASIAGLHFYALIFGELFENHDIDLPSFLYVHYLIAVAFRLPGELVWQREIAWMGYINS